MILKTKYILGVLMLLGLLAISGCKKQHNWNITLREDGEEPYDLRVFTRLLKDAVGSDHYKNPEYNLPKELESIEEKTLYVYAGNYPFYKVDELEALRKFVDDGNSLLIVTNAFQQVLADSLCDLNMAEGVSADSIYGQTLPLWSFNDSAPEIKHTKTGSKAPVYYKEGTKINTVGWEFFQDSLLRLAGAHKKLVLNDEYALAVELPRETGKIIFMSEALPVTNYHLRNKQNFEVVNDLLAEFEFETVIFDNSRGFANMQNDGFQRSPLFYFFQFPGFRYAWLTLLAMALLYLLFNSKRKVRAMQLLPDKSNKSLLYVHTVSLMYYKNKAHLQIARMAGDVFLFEVRRKYRINTSKLDAEFIDALAAKTKKPRSEAKSLTNKIISLKGLTTLSEDGFLRFFETLNDFKRVMKQ